MNLEEMSLADQKGHLEKGGTFESQGGALKLRYLPEDGLCVIVNRTGNQGNFVTERLAAAVDIAEQLAPLGTWEASGP